MGDDADHKHDGHASPEHPTAVSPSLPGAEGVAKEATTVSVTSLETLPVTDTPPQTSPETTDAVVALPASPTPPKSPRDTHSGDRSDKTGVTKDTDGNDKTSDGTSDGNDKPSDTNDTATNVTDTNTNETTEANETNDTTNATNVTNVTNNATNNANEPTSPIPGLKPATTPVAQSTYTAASTVNTTPSGHGSDTNSVGSTPGSTTGSVAIATCGGREINPHVLYVAGVDASVKEAVLLDLFKVTGNIKSIKIFPDRQKANVNFAFVEYDDKEAAQLAMQTLNNRQLHGHEISISFAFQTKVERDYNLFVGDLGADVNDEMLHKHFAHIPGLLDARVMWDMTSGRSRGYGFVSFETKQGAERGLIENGSVLGSRVIRANWASSRRGVTPGQMGPQGGRNNMGGHMGGHMGGPMGGHMGGGMGMGGHMGGMGGPMGGFNNGMGNFGAYGNQGMGGGGGGGPHHGGPGGHNMMNNNNNNRNYRDRSDRNNDRGGGGQGGDKMGLPKTIYIGNLPNMHPSELIPLLQNFGYVVELKHHSNYAFVSYDSHKRAQVAMTQLNGYNIHGRTLKCGWGRDRR
ncbi:Nuclear and cytoplasmic polyadenylated RNA-binding protein [Yarrowia sp. C11]|nr:Nuclear and cytoplasmic polyadenylated RNA-binding protein [Yarrowia sp. C11]